MKKPIIFILIIFLALLAGLAGWWIRGIGMDREMISLINTPPKRPFDIYTIENLSKTNIKPGKLILGEIINEGEESTSYFFSFEFNPNLDGKTQKKTMGQTNISAGSGPFPIVIMLRGYVDQKIYKTGDGTRKAAAVFAENGFITVAPDFLGYGSSDSEASNIFEARFQTYVTVLSLIKSLDQIDNWDKKNIFLWGHSNGGQIALTILEITGASHPTTLWAPVSKPFPYSILFYTDASVDRGKLIREELAKFEKDYNPDLYSLDQYLDKINTPLQIHQGTADDAVPVSWSDQLTDNLLELNLDLSYYQYPGANHNMVPLWNRVVNRDLEFFSENLKY